MPAPGSRSAALGLALALLAAGFAGCIGATGEDDFASLEAARQQSVSETEPEQPSPVRLGLIEPNTTGEVPQGQQNVTVVLWNEATGEAVTDADVTLDAFMPMMGHGTNPETDPTHLRNGVYRGSTNLMMAGNWVLHVNATLASGEELHFPVDVKVAGDGGHGGHGHMGHDKGPNTTYASYEDAKAAEGGTFAPKQNTTHRLKLLEPAQREGLESGATNVTILVYDQAEDEPVTNATAYLNATMPAMDHGTSPETDPAHAAHGVWKGQTTLTMNGTWILGVEMDTGNESLSWAINVTVGNGSMDHGMHDEPAFEPYEEVFEDDVSGADYAVNHTLPVEAANATLTMNGTLSGAPPLDEVTVELYDANDTKLGSFTLSSNANESSLTVEEAPIAGDYTVRVSGTAVDAHYRVAVHVTPP